ncbi:MAG: hypothetical protein AB1700_07200 [Bacillota bacterium]
MDLLTQLLLGDLRGIKHVYDSPFPQRRFITVMMTLSATGWGMTNP